ncbi:MAG: hypothetical protein JW779_12485 [Candidatus Thorarchaeota archaeon]|nr:hypothetical protein [Candidatus Thorarchaeota archaeon]
MKHTRLLIWIIVSVVAAIILGFILSPIVLKPPAQPPAPIPPEGNDQLAFLVTLKTIVSFVNIALIATLLGLYYRIYSEIRSRFTLGLILLILVLLMYAITSNPLIHILFGYYPFGLGPFTVLPDLFSSFALIVLLYLSSE